MRGRTHAHNSTSPACRGGGGRGAGSGRSAARGIIDRRRRRTRAICVVNDMGRRAIAGLPAGAALLCAVATMTSQAQPVGASVLDALRERKRASNAEYFLGPVRVMRSRMKTLQSASNAAHDLQFASLDCVPDADGLTGSAGYGVRVNVRLNPFLLFYLYFKSYTEFHGYIASCRGLTTAKSVSLVVPPLTHTFLPLLDRLELHAGYSRTGAGERPCISFFPRCRANVFLCPSTCGVAMCSWQRSGPSTCRCCRC